jgi:LCP family protein required for cell wall assembly
VIIVGQNVLATAADKRSEATHNDADAVLHEAVKIQEHLLAQDHVLESLADKLARVEGVPAHEHPSRATVPATGGRCGPNGRLPVVSEPPSDEPGALALGTPSDTGSPTVATPDDQSGNSPSRTERRKANRAQSSRRRKHIGLVVLGSLVGLVLLIVAAGAAFLWYENNRIHRVDVKHLATVQARGAQKDVQNILLIGSTTRCGLKQQSTAFGLCDQGVTGVNSDVVMILHLDPDHHRASILSIPRDTLVPNARPGGINKIDAALGAPDGPGQLIAAITDDFGIPIQHYVELNFDSFQGIVEALGGVRMYFPLPVYGQQSSLYFPSTGCMTLNGFQALAVVRARHLQYQPATDHGMSRYDWPYDPQSDLSRIRRDHEFLRVLASSVATRGLGNFVTDLRLIDSLSGNLEVDKGLSATTIANLVLEFHRVNTNAAPQYTLPVVEDGQGYFYRGGGYGDVVFPVQPQDGEVVSEFLGTKATEDASGRALPSPGSFTVAVENGGGLSDEGATTAAALKQLGYNVSSITDTAVGASTTEATILYSQPDELADALRLQSALSGLAVIGYDPGLISGGRGAASGSVAANAGRGSGATTNSTIDVGSGLSTSENSDVVLVTGSNFAVNPPTSVAPSAALPGSSSTTSGVSSGLGVGSTTTTTVSGPLINSPNLSAPSGPSEPLQPWDPRSCTPTGGAGP